jgi:hypothetical protein
MGWFSVTLCSRRRAISLRDFPYPVLYIYSQSETFAAGGHYPNGCVFVISGIWFHAAIEVQLHPVESSLICGVMQESIAMEPGSSIFARPFKRRLGSSVAVAGPLWSRPFMIIANKWESWRSALWSSDTPTTSRWGETMAKNEALVLGHPLQWRPHRIWSTNRTFGVWFLAASWAKNEEGSGTAVRYFLYSHPIVCEPFPG